WLDHLAVDYDEGERWITLCRGGLRIVCNLSTEPVKVPVTGDVLLAWGQPTVDADSTVLEGHSFVVLRAGS
ncbi:MAG TPA: DUF3459 domain-containing protein, partial [Mycobacterium sp.]|nr:DUF3459 domain-containing protein [Mycobacterium sp.]